MARRDGAPAPGAFVQLDQPWTDTILAPLYDHFPNAVDLPFYLELAAVAGGRVLELCCGSGRLLLPLAEAGHTVVGLDTSRPMLALAEQKLAAAGAPVAERVRLVQGDMRSPSLGAAGELGEPFAVAIIASKSFAYLLDRADQQRVLTSLAAQLRLRGLLAFDLLHPTPAWLLEPPGSLRQDLVHHDPTRGVTVARTETVVSTDLAAQVRVLRSAYEVVQADGTVRKRFVEWPFRYVYRHEAELLLEGAGFTVEAVYGGYAREPFTSDSPLMVFLARRR